MPSIIVFPSSLPAPYGDAYTETMPTEIARSSMDMGADKVRRRQSRGVRKISCKYRLTLAEKTVFENFYNNDLQGGVRYFNWRGLVVRFVEEDAHSVGKWSRVQGSLNYWDIDIVLEVEP